jgi:predicted DCC family thiol-disulfide oxidoreductase YuxK
MKMTVVFYDGECGFCHESVKWLRWLDRRKALRYAPLQGTTAEEVLGRHGVAGRELTGLWVAVDVGTPRERLWHRSDAALEALRRCGGWGAVLSWARWIPRAVREWVYGRVARIRYHVYGRRSACDLPKAEERECFLP